MRHIYGWSWLHKLVAQLRLGLHGKFNRKAHTFPIRMNLKINMYAYKILYKNITCIYNHAGKNKQ